MFHYDGSTVRMTRGDYGVPLPIRVREACADCADGLMENDELRFIVARGAGEFLWRKTTLCEVETNSGIWPVTLTKDEADAMPPGRYRWSIALLRDGVLRNTLLGPALWEVR